jgi:hypothetical protein
MVIPRRVVLCLYLMLVISMLLAPPLTVLFPQTFGGSALGTVPVTLHILILT